MKTVSCTILLLSSKQSINDKEICHSDDDHFLKNKNHNMKDASAVVIVAWDE